jgi:hypothetical protein
MGVLESLSTLNEKYRSEQKKLVIRGRSKASIDNLERAIIQINVDKLSNTPILPRILVDSNTVIYSSQLLLINHCL